MGFLRLKEFVGAFFIILLFSIVPPDILDDSTSMDMVVREGNDVTLRCAASGSPPPTVAWRRETTRGISLGNGSYGKSNQFQVKKCRRKLKRSPPLKQQMLRP